MKKASLRWLTPAFVVAAAVLLSACSSERPLAPDSRPAIESALESSSALASQAPDLDSCEKLNVSDTTKVVFRAFATGVQIYRWNGTTWSFVAPEATLFANADGTGEIGIHYAGPTWASNSGSKVVAAVIDRCTPDTTAIPWLLLGAVSTEGPGIFHRVALIQRVNTVGGTAPATPGSVVGEEVRVPYSAEYFFYRPE
jgi:hypothetical protein